MSSATDHEALRDLVRRFAECEVAPQAAHHDQHETFNRSLFEQAGKLGLLGLLAPEEVGGTGMDATACAIVHEELAWADPGFALAYLSHAVLFVNALARHGISDVTRPVLEAACAGTEIGAVAMSEPGAGTDILAMQTRAVRNGENYVIDGTKTWITNGVQAEGALADRFLVYARTSDQVQRGLSLFLVSGQTPGFSLGRAVTGKLGMRAASCAELFFNRCQLSATYRIGGEGSALMQMLRTLEIERVALAAIGVGIGLRALQIMNAYASDRRVEGKPLRHFGQIQRQLAETHAEVLAARALLYQVTGELDLDRPGPGLGADSVKLVAARSAQAATDRAIQVLGGNGYIVDFEVERLWRDARLLSIGGGTNEALQKNITRNLARITGRLS